jgi:predicted XRE-type DNA-binding protein
MPNKNASRLKGDLMATLINHAAHKGWTEAEVSKRFGVTVPRASELLRSQFNRFSLDDLVGMATRAGLHIELEIGGDA